MPQGCIVGTVQVPEIMFPLMADTDKKTANVTVLSRHVKIFCFSLLYNCGTVFELESVANFFMDKIVFID